MTSNRKRAHGETHLTTEPGGWIALRRSAATSADPVKFLSASESPQIGNLRYADDGGNACQIAELRDPTGLLTAHKQLFEFASTTEPTRDEVAEILSELPGEWTQPQGHTDRWQAIVNDARGERCELTATIVAGGVEVTALLASWEDKIADTSPEAIARLLAAAHSRIRFVRFQLQPDRVIAASFVAAERLAVDLPESVSAVATAVGRMGKSVRVLLHGGVAEAYVENACARK